MDNYLNVTLPSGNGRNSGFKEPSVHSSFKTAYTSPNTIMNKTQMGFHKDVGFNKIDLDRS
jgi:hypothetical protein